MPSLCLYFQVHQPYRLSKYSFFDIGEDRPYFDTEANVAILNKVAEKCYLPASETFYQLIKKYKGAFKMTLSFSGVLLEQLEAWRPDVLYAFRKLIDTGCVEVLAETYHHSLSSIYSPKEFEQEVLQHERLIWKYFKVSPVVFRNTELIYNNEIAAQVQYMGYKGMLAEGLTSMMSEHVQSPNFLHHPPERPDFPVLLKNYRLSDDIAFRFSNMDWEQYPLTADKYASWIHELVGQGDMINLFMDYETFGEHQWAETGIFNFLNYLPEHILKYPACSFKTPTEIIDSYSVRGVYDVPNVSSWADTERDLSAWAGNPMQQEALRRYFDLEEMVKACQDEQLVSDWKKLSTSDHFYYMCLKKSSDGAVHDYFSPYASPLEAYNYFINAITDVEYRLSKIDKTTSTTAKESLALLNV